MNGHNLFHSKRNKEHFTFLCLRKQTFEIFSEDKDTELEAPVGMGLTFEINLKKIPEFTQKLLT